MAWVLRRFYQQLIVENLYWLDRIQPSECPLVGDRAFSLSQLLQRGYPVLPGFVVPTSAFWEFLEPLGKTEPLLADLPHSSFYVDVDNPQQLQLVAQQIRQDITTAVLPSTWSLALSEAAEIMQAPAVILHPSLWLRSPGKTWPALDTSSARWENSLEPSHASVYGILASHTCSIDKDALAVGLKQVWAELFRARSLFYWQRHGIGLRQLNLAVLVQPIWDAIASGTLQTDLGEWTIQSTVGFGEALTQGVVFPDQYQVQAETGAIKTQRLGNKTWAYRLSREPKRHKSSESVLNLYFLSEEQQQQYALEENELTSLIKLCQRLVSDISPTLFLEWTIYQSPDRSQSQLYLTQLTPQPSMSPEPQTPPLVPQLVRGLPASAGRVTAPAQVIKDEHQNLEAIAPGKILVARSVAPEWLSWLKRVAAIVTEQGGMTSHAAILARELGIPAVVGAGNVTQLIQTGDVLMVDGDQGELHRLASGQRGTPPERENSQVAQDESQKTQSLYPITSSSPRSIPFSSFPIVTQLLINVSQPQDLEAIAGLPVDGVGLLRSELMMLNALDNLPLNQWLRQGRERELVERLAHLIIQFAASFRPRPVFYRSLDWRSHEFQFLSGQTSQVDAEVNPIIGLRGTRRYLIDPSGFDLELAALKQVYDYGYTNVRLMLPFVRTVEEFAFCRRRAEQAELFDNPYFQVWIMAEVPSVLFLLPDYVKAGVQGISIGTNDLTQLLLATDRDREQLGTALDGRHPAVQRALKHLIQTAQTCGIPCSICGQAPAQYPELIDGLVQWGITSISVDMNDVEQTYSAIARAEQRLLLAAARQKISDQGI
ncbi:MAG TPA: putative PEP-binding protein [Coleofasciculaceae cyanobacterium]